MSDEKLDRAELGKRVSVYGFAHEHIALGILMKRYMNVSKVDLPLSTYDLIIVLNDDVYGHEEIIRCQVKTASSSVKFTGGTRGGVDRVYLSGVKKYRQSAKTSDVVIGVTPRQDGGFDLYFVPTIIVGILDQDSISLGRIGALKNNYEILENCKNEEYVISECKRFGIIQ
jgi:hypothetical protein